MGMVMYLRHVGDANLDEVSSSSDHFNKFLFDDAAMKSGRLIDFDKAWHGLHFVLSGEVGATEHPLGILVNMDSEPGSVRLVAAETMRQFDSALRELTDEDLRDRYNAAEMARYTLYMSDWFVEEGSEGWSYIAQNLTALRKFSADCVMSNSSALVVLN